MSFKPNLGIIACAIGEVPERPIGAVSKTVVALVVTVGSNPTLSAQPAVTLLVFIFRCEGRPSPLNQQ